MKNNKIKYREIKITNYFLRAKPGIRFILIILGLASITIAILSKTIYKGEYSDLFLYCAIFGLVACVISYLIYAIWIFGNNMNSKKYYNAVREDFTQVYNKSFDILGIEKEKLMFHEPIISYSAEVFPGHDYNNFYLDTKTGNLFYSFSKYYSILFGEKSFYLYSCNVNHITGDVSYELAKEYEYASVVGVTTQTTIVTKKNMPHDVLFLYITTKDGLSHEIVLRDKVCNQESYVAPKLKMKPKYSKSIIFVLVQFVLSVGLFAVGFHFGAAVFKQNNQILIKVLCGAVLFLVSFIPIVILAFLKSRINKVYRSMPMSDEEIEVVQRIRKTLRNGKNI